MKISVDTNVLLRALVHDDKAQAKAAEKLLQSASTVYISLACWCELVWVLRSNYKMPARAVIDAVAALATSSKVECDLQAIEAGIAMLENGADFADGVIAFDGRVHNAATFVSFDAKAVSRLQALGHAARLAG